MISDGAPWLSIVTVVRNDVVGFAATAESVAQQNLTGVEYIVIDSSDSPDEVPSVLRHLPQLNAQYRWQPAQGIYPAMNNGIECASGEYIFFANAGDTFARHDVIAKIHEVTKSEQPDWIIGLVEIVERSGRVVVSPKWDFVKEKSHYFSRGFFAPHQGTFASTSLLKSHGGFNINFDIAADYALFLQLTAASEPLMIDLVIGRFVEGGVSTKHWRKSFVEFHRARRQVFKLRGFDSLLEYLDTATHFTRVACVKSLRKIGLFT